MSALLEVDQVTLRYKTAQSLVTATHRVSFHVNEGDRYVLLGPSGCGKSTLLKAVGGYILPYEGSIRIRDRKVERPGDDRMMVFQEFDQLLPWKTVLLNVMFPLRVGRKMNARMAETRAIEYLAKVRLTDFADSYPRTLSGGMKQRVAIARGMAMKPDILLMDEPFAALDALTRRRMQDELLALWQQTHFTVLFVTHSIEEAIRIGNRILLLSPRPGRIKAEIEGVDRIKDNPKAASELEREIHDLLFKENFTPADVAQEMAMSEVVPSEAVVLDEDFSYIISHHALDDAHLNVEAERRLGALELLWGSGTFRKSLIIVLLAVFWETYARDLNNPLLFPFLSETLVAGEQAMRDGTLLDRTWSSIQTLLVGYSIGIALAAVLSVFAITTRIGSDLLETATAMFNPLPAIALLPLALIWFGLGSGSIVFVLVHSVLWAVALNTHAGFLAVSEILRMVGQNYGLRGLPYIARIYVPAAFVSILTGLKIGWAFAWRTLIAAELVFGVSSGQGGLGWFIFERRNTLDVAGVFCGLLTVILIGLVVENLIFRTIERLTVKRWGMQ